MRLEELFPIFGGLSLGCVARILFQRSRRGAVILAAVVIAISATVTSGEFLQSWGFLLVDISLVAISGVIGFFATSARYPHISKRES